MNVLDIIEGVLIAKETEIASAKQELEALQKSYWHNLLTLESQKFEFPDAENPSISSYLSQITAKKDQLNLFMVELNRLTALRQKAVDEPAYHRYLEQELSRAV